LKKDNLKGVSHKVLDMMKLKDLKLVFLSG